MKTEKSQFVRNNLAAGTLHWPLREKEDAVDSISPPTTGSSSSVWVCHFNIETERMYSENVYGNPRSHAWVGQVVESNFDVIVYI